jgi:hypothetical protein
MAPSAPVRRALEADTPVGGIYLARNTERFGGGEGTAV